uniref:Uncharacterized protein n=1 Tax=viral metagenome TaxID=1070528 RepID=A0A6C0FAR0_9ZZZZ|tara:strand:- start:1363 stop:1479 length:117 start_codon:yes stop_codon:yes gene_type:complete
MPKKMSESKKRESAIIGTIQQKEDAESLVDSIAFGTYE